MHERGATLEEVIATVETGERFPAKFNRTGFRRNFSFGAEWRGRTYASKQVEVYAVDEDGWRVLKCYSEVLLTRGEQDAAYL